jgi:murein DD-endopeptidase MepM/ murein hydrolase activator NlpD
VRVLHATLLALMMLSPAAVHYRAPVPGAVIASFRPPPTPFAAGHRGLEYATTPGEPVRAAAAGMVTFAGRVAGAQIVVVAHADRLRTTYEGLASTDVGTGALVAAGQPVGSAGSRVYFGVRAGTAYLDPAVVLAPPRRRARLVPVGT